MDSEEIRGQAVALRPLRLSDANALDRFLRDRRATRMLPPRVRRETGPQHLHRVLQEVRRGQGVAFAIQTMGPREVIGQIRLFGWNRSLRQAEIGYWIRRKQWGMGLGTEAVFLTCRFGFRRMHLHRIGATVVKGNQGSVRVLEKVGFRLEGRSRQAFWLAGSWVDALNFGLLRAEFEASRPAER